MFDAVPSGLKCLFKGTVNNDKVSLRSDITIKGVTITDKRWNNYFIYNYFCGAESEDAVHLFLNCIYSQMFWIDFEGLLCKYLDLNVYFSVFFYLNTERLPPNVSFIVNLCLIMGKYHIHKQKWAEGKPNLLLFLIDMKHYIELLLGLKNSKAQRTRSICESFALCIIVSYLFL